MKTYLRTGIAAAALLLMLHASPARADATPVEQSADQIQTLRATQSQFWREFDSFVNSSTPMPLMEVSRRITAKVDEEPVRLALALAWAKDKIAPKDMSRVNSLFFLIYSDMAQRSTLSVPKSSPYYMAYSKAAYQALVTFELLFLTDAARCVNPAAASSARALVDKRYENLKYVEDAATPADMETYWKTALNYEAAAAQRPGNGEICSNGVADALAADTHELPPERVDAAFIDDAKWMPLREKIRADTAAQWQKDYASIRKAWEARKAYANQQKAAAEAAKQAQAKAEADKQAADAQKQKEAEEQLAKEKQKRDEAQKKEQGKYHDTYVPEPSQGIDDSGGGGGGD